MTKKGKMYRYKKSHWFYWIDESNKISIINTKTDKLYPTELQIKKMFDLKRKIKKLINEIEYNANTTVY